MVGTLDCVCEYEELIRLGNFNGCLVLDLLAAGYMGPLRVNAPRIDFLTWRSGLPILKSIVLVIFSNQKSQKKLRPGGGGIHKA